MDARTLVGQALRDALAQVLMTRGAADLDSKELIGWLDAADGRLRESEAAFARASGDGGAVPAALPSAANPLQRQTPTERAALRQPAHPPRH